MGLALIYHLFDDRRLLELFLEHRSVLSGNVENLHNGCQLTGETESGGPIYGFRGEKAGGDCRPMISLTIGYL